MVQVHVGAPFSKQHVRDELLDVRGESSMFANDDNHVSRKSRRQGDTNQLLPLIVKRQRADWHKADPHSEGYQVDD